MLERPKLTARQQEILDLIKSAITRTGSPPTRAEIATTLGFKSANAAEEHLQALARKGVIELVSGTSRGIRLKSDTLRAINESRNKSYSLTLPGMAQLALPLIGRVAAGSPILAQEHIDQTYYVENSLFQHRPDYLLKVRGMSMRDAGIMDGDLLAVQSSKDAKNGQIVVARLGEEVTVKRFRRNKDLIELHPENPDYQTITQSHLSATTLNAHHAFTPNPPSAAKCHLGQSQPALTTLAPRKPLRVIRVLEKDHVPATVGRMVISGRMADVCAELDRLADREAALH
jgi:repressor LexA